MTQDQAIAEITRRLVDFYRPERIYLFSSAARGGSGPDSDLDFCVVLPDDAPPALYRPGVYRALWGVGTAADVVRCSASDFDRRASHVKASLPARSFPCPPRSHLLDILRSPHRHLRLLHSHSQ